MSDIGCCCKGWPYHHVGFSRHRIACARTTKVGDVHLIIYMSSFSYRSVVCFGIRTRYVCPVGAVGRVLPLVFVSTHTVEVTHLKCSGGSYAYSSNRSRNVGGQSRPYGYRGYCGSIAAAAVADYHRIYTVASCSSTWCVGGIAAYITNRIGTEYSHPLVRRFI